MEYLHRLYKELHSKLFQAELEIRYTAVDQYTFTEE